MAIGTYTVTIEGAESTLPGEFLTAITETLDAMGLTHQGVTLEWAPRT